MRQQRKPVWFILILLTAALITGCKNQQGNTENNEVKLQGKFGVAAGVPVRVVDGNLYRYNTDGTWTEIVLDRVVDSVLSGENLCILDKNGKVYYAGLSEYSEEESYPLTSAYHKEMIQKMIEINGNSFCTDMNTNLDYIDARALLENGDILYHALGEYKYYTLPDEKPVSLSGQFVLTEEGNVYSLCTDTDNVELEIVYAGGDIVMISASETSSRCVGLKENGEVMAWNMNNVQTSLEVNDWKHIVSVCQGFNYAVGLDSGGKVYFESWDEEQTDSMNKNLDSWENIVEIAVYFDVIVGLQEDGTCVFINITDY